MPDYKRYLLTKDLLESTIPEHSKIKEILISQGYSIVPKHPSWFTIRPELYLEKNKEKTAIFIRQSDSIPEMFIQRISLMIRRTAETKCTIVFCKCPNKTTLRQISLYGIDVKLFSKNHLRDLSTREKTNVSTPTTSQKVRRLEQIKIFISSHQEIEERTESKELIEEIATAHRWPLFPICIEEDHRYTIKQTDRCERDNLNDSDWFIGILAESFRTEVNKEVRRAYTQFDPDNIFMLVKNNKKTKENWAKLISYMDGFKDIKYLPYNDVGHLKAHILGKITYKMKKIHQEKGIPFMS